MTKKVDVRKLITDIQKAAQDKPGYVYQRGSEGGCAYFHNERGSWVPGCIVGHGFHQQAVAFEDVQAANGCGIDTILNGDRSVNIELSGGGLPERRWLEVAQERQDAGWPWGVAVETAGEVVSAEFGVTL